MMNFQRMKKILRKIFFLPPVPTLLISIPSYGLVIYALTGESVNPVIAYVSYFLSAYALIITVTGITCIVCWIRQGIDKHPLVRKALVSMLSLETAMLTQFGAADDPMFRRIMTASTGAGISIIVLGMAVYMIVWSTRQLKRDKQEKEA